MMARKIIVENCTECPYRYKMQIKDEPVCALMFFDIGSYNNKIHPDCPLSEEV